MDLEGVTDEVRDETFFARFFEGTDIDVSEERVINITYKKEPIALINPQLKYAEFFGLYEDPGNHDHELKAFTDFLAREGYRTNLK
ncbi:hypothetical protein HYT24_01875 [Candidatus Pacearchaeota archaeon]|nr:hypothetical protein [Candidatus Pacearchaeota archaeon]